MSKFYKSIIKDRVLYNNDQTDSQMVLEEDYSESRHYFWGLFKTEYEKEIRQDIAEKKSKSLGFGQ